MAQNEYGTYSKKISLVSSSLSIVPEDAWNPYLERFEIAIGASLEVECRVSFYLQPKWMLNSSVFDTSRSIVSVNTLPTDAYFAYRRMEIKNFVESDEGLYSCADIEDVGDAIDYIYVHAMKRMTPKIVSNFREKPDHRIERNIGESIHLECSVAEMSIRSFKWFKNSQPIPENDDEVERNYFLSESSEETEDDDSDYDFTDYSDLDKPNLFEITKKIINLTEDDEGNYSCIATNAFGRDEHFVEISIRSKLKCFSTLSWKRYFDTFICRHV